MYSADLMNRSQTRPEIGEGGFETGSWAFRCRHPLFPLVRGVRREHLERQMNDDRATYRRRLSGTQTHAIFPDVEQFSNHQRSVYSVQDGPEQR
jgi:hypothetical protein